MEIASKEKMTTLAMVCLCIIIGAMVLLAVVYYGQASTVQSKANSQIATYQAEKAELQQRIDSLNAQVSSLANQVATLSKQNQDLAIQVVKTGPMLNFYRTHALSTLKHRIMVQVLSNNNEFVEIAETTQVHTHGAGKAEGLLCVQ